ncbi:threonine synthase [Sunxiuqinia elliptica]|uniref:Threonine synthase n=1 Tax=Sunxiuqinia elliptica TaxID=655355 RepID=A0A4R6GMY5_9BACT|nr:threonine synthase [Sunxiuqinia elliptica]TDN95695.1 L-threonine synthase [Sunxiuqinia elliptica]TDO66890.1 L-threonine synthase [Sunxiuqinia elliptica]
MKYYSTNKTVSEISLKEAVTKGLADDKGLFMPERIEAFPPSFFETIHQLSFQEIAFEVAKKFFGEDIPNDDLKTLVDDTLNFDCPIAHVNDNIFALELWHGPTLAFKDVGGRFMARLLGYFLQGNEEQVNVLVATSGDTGSAVANGFLGVPGIHVYVLYPKGLVSEIQEKQFTTLGQNITAIEVDGTFDDCQRLVKTAFLDEELKSQLTLTSANSINVARFLPQAFYYFNAYARLRERGLTEDLVVAVPSGNFGNLTAGLFGKKMGLPIKRFIAANNENDIVYNYLKTGQYEPRPSVATIANAMDVGDPSNFARILDLYDHSHEAIKAEMIGYRYSDAEIREVVKEVYHKYGYLTDPHGATAYKALDESLQDGEVGVFLETAHPAKFTETVEKIIGLGKVNLPEKLAAFMKGEKQTVPLSKDFEAFKKYLLAKS